MFELFLPVFRSSFKGCVISATLSKTEAHPSLDFHSLPPPHIHKNTAQSSLRGHGDRSLDPLQILQLAWMEDTWCCCRFTWRAHVLSVPRGHHCKEGMVHAGCNQATNQNTTHFNNGPMGLLLDWPVRAAHVLILHLHAWLVEGLGGNYFSINAQPRIHWGRALEQACSLSPEWHHL